MLALGKLKKVEHNHYDDDNNNDDDDDDDVIGGAKCHFWLDRQYNIYIHQS